MKEEKDEKERGSCSLLEYSSLLLFSKFITYLENEKSNHYNISKKLDYLEWYCTFELFNGINRIKFSGDKNKN